jgi:hypothetical protein
MFTVKAIRPNVDTFRCRTFTLINTSINIVEKNISYLMLIQSNLYTTTILGTKIKWPLLTDGRCSEEIYVVKVINEPQSDGLY